MGFFKPRFPDVDPDEFLRKPLMERDASSPKGGWSTGSHRRGWYTPSIKQDHGHGALA
jgi:hypothetical protein